MLHFDNVFLIINANCHLCILDSLKWLHKYRKNDEECHSYLFVLNKTQSSQPDCTIFLNVKGGPPTLFCLLLSHPVVAFSKAVAYTTTSRWRKQSQKRPYRSFQPLSCYKIQHMSMELTRFLNLWFLRSRRSAHHKETMPKFRVYQAQPQLHRLLKM